MFDGLVGGKHHSEAVLGDAGESLGGVDTALVEKGVDAIGKELGDEGGRALEGDGVARGCGGCGLHEGGGVCAEELMGEGVIVCGWWSWRIGKRGENEGMGCKFEFCKEKMWDGVWKAAGGGRR